MNATLEGKITCDGRPVEGAEVRILGTAESLGTDPRATSYAPMMATWSRTITGYEGNTWNLWQKYVAREVAGMTWEEFKVEVVQYNPSLRDTNEGFEAERTYSIPEAREFEDTGVPLPEVVWDRRITGFSGSLWDGWRACVQTKVAGLTWEAFQAEVVDRNPDLAQDDHHFRADKSYVLPRNAGQDQFTRVTFTSTTGRFRFVELMPGTYRLRVRAKGYQAWADDLEFSTDLTRDVELDHIRRARAKDVDRFVRVEGNHFIVNKRVFRFIGVNMTGLAYYGTDVQDFAYRYADPHRQLQEAWAMGARVVRLWLPHEDMLLNGVVGRLQFLLDLMGGHFGDMYLIVAFTDLHSNTHFHPQHDKEEESFWSQSGEYTILSPQWFREGYTNNYLPLVEKIVETFNDDRQIFAWEIGNELKVDHHPGLAVDFHLKMAERIRSLDPNHLITTGMVSTHHAWMRDSPQLQRKLYGSDHIDFITNHDYDGRFIHDDSKLAQDLPKPKPFIVEEAGFAAGPGENRGQRVTDNMRTWFGLGASGYMQWGFQARDTETNDGDSRLGMDTVPAWHTDYESLFNAYLAQAKELEES